MVEDGKAAKTPKGQRRPRGRRGLPPCWRFTSFNPTRVERFPRQEKRRDPSALPQEIRTAICQLLSSKDMKNLRQLSKPWADTTRPILFKTFRLRVSLDSYGNIEKMSSNPSLREYVKTIDYDGNTIDTHAAAHGFDRWLSCGAGSGLGLVPKDMDRFVDQFTKRQLEQYYQNYRRYGLGQDYLLRDDYARESLVKALKRFPAIYNMRYGVTSGRIGNFGGKLPSLDSLSSIAQEILAEPTGYSRYRNTEEQFWALLESLCEAGHSVHLGSVHGKQLDLQRWDKIAQSLVCHKQLPALHDLSLEFAFAQHEQDETTQLSDMIAHAPTLQTLRLSFGQLSFDNPSAMIPLPDVISDGAELGRLRALSLTAVKTTEGCLRKLMRRLSETLRSLDLSTIQFEQASPPDEHGRGSWILFMTFLEEELQLSHVLFSGSLTNGWSEAWVSGDDDHVDIGLRGMEITKAFAKDCLKYQIERYVTHRGPSPFVEKNGDEHYGCYSLNKLPWKLNLDNSWGFEERLLT